MDDISVKGPVTKLSPTKKSAPFMRNTSSFWGHGPQPSNKLACSSKLNIMKDGQGGSVGCSHKARSVRSSICLAGAEEVPGSSSRSGSSASKVRNPKNDVKKKIAALQLGTESLETSSVGDQPEVQKVVSSPEKISKGIEKSSKKGVTIREVGSTSSGTASILGSRSGSNFNSSMSSKAKGMRLQPLNSNMSQCGLRNLRYSSKADVILSSSDTLKYRSMNKRKDMSKGQTSKGEASISRGNKTHETFMSSRNGVSITESRSETGGTELNRSIAAVRMRWSARNPSERTTRSSSLSAPQFTFQRWAHHDLPVDGNDSGSSTSNQLPGESTYRRFTLNNHPESSSSRLSPVAEPSSHDSLDITSHTSVNWEKFQQYTMEGIAEMLSALERIERENLNFEQLFSLETNVLPNDLNIYDQHRDMRMDIDGMTYEELLALEERMGSVSTALTDEALSKCLKRELYHKTKHDDEAANMVEKDETKCSICQEEYADKDEIGRLHCKHMYHADCINQWLSFKNWCPICKGSAESSPSSPRP
ncbi:hypothetical protein SAY87_019211 [Trapa incisa]|uniref:RING-type E3 ubiquitin transferase n=1 Tax=Trapa incisa TaxID=236973 RepID=A0AAN7Q6X8_9MYRT|nr:hypothetical protein SAY87_019211 [Trapa incisa]